MALGTLLSIAAIIRIRASLGRLLGKAVARAALVISLLWWALLALIFVAVMLMAAGWTPRHDVVEQTVEDSLGHARGLSNVKGAKGRDYRRGTRHRNGNGAGTRQSRTLGR